LLWRWDCKFIWLIPRPFPNRIENTHVIDESQIFVAAVCRGPASHELKSTYEKRDDAGYISDLGNSIVNIAKTVPGGILVFFTSYAVLQQTVDKWKKSARGTVSIWTRIEKSKRAFLETKSKTDFATLIHAYENSITADTGAIFFAVCKGKASEGIDFSDSKARAVVMCGIPFPNTRDSRVSIKKEMLNNYRELARLGDVWYQQQAHRAVNQAIGRAIRHRNDFGAIILLDIRFTESSMQKNLPIWVKNEVNNYVSN
jgi:regulator of telomere elongation helicase 1